MPSRSHPAPSTSANQFGIFLKYAEYILLGAYFFIGAWLATHFSCSEGICQFEKIGELGFFRWITSIIIICGILSAARTTWVYIQYFTITKKEEADYLYAISTISQTGTYILIGAFIEQILLRSQTGAMNSAILLIISISIIVSIASLLADKKFWEESSFFVRARLTLSLVLQITLFINPFLAAIISIFVIPFMIFIKENPIIEEN